MSRYEAVEKARDWVVLDTEARITLVHYGCGKLGGRRNDMSATDAGDIARATASMLNAAHAAGLAEGTAKRYERMPFDEAVLMFDEAGVRCPRCKYPEPADVIDLLGLRHGIWISTEVILRARSLGSVERLQELLRPRNLVAVEIPGQRTWRIERMPAAQPCTGAAADWCPEHGDCTCEGGDGAPIDKACPLHSDESSHAAVGAGT